MVGATTHVFFFIMHFFTSKILYRFSDITYSLFAYIRIGKPITVSISFNVAYPILTYMQHCRTKGFLSFLILWLINKKSMTGAEIASELKKRKGKKPSPGTIYPVLKHMKDNQLLSIDQNKRYTLTDNGKKNLEIHLDAFIKTFYDIDEMKSCCCKQKSSNIITP